MLAWVLALVSALLAGCEPAPLRLAYVGSITGRTGDLGVGGRDAALLAVEQLNAAGGIRGRRVELDSHDLRHDADVARGVMATLKVAGHTLAVGPMTSAMAMAMVPMANELGITLISPTVTTSELDGLDDQFFRVASSVRVYARRSAEFHSRHSGWRRYSVVFDSSNLAYTRTWMEQFAAALQEQGGGIVAEQGFVYAPDLSFDELARQALSTEADALLIIANAIDAARVAQAVRRLSPQRPMLATEWAATEQFLALGARALEGLHQTQFLDRESQAMPYLEFLNNFEARFGREPGFAEVAAFDATRIALRALAERRDGESVKQTLLRLRRFDGLQQAIEFTPEGDAERNISITVVRNGRFVVVH